MIAVVDAWEAAGHPEPNWTGRSKTPRPCPRSRVGVCALTGVAGEVFPVTEKILSGMFTTWDRLPHRYIDPDGLALCEAAVWAFKDRTLMSRPHGMWRGEWRELAPSELADLLTTSWTDRMIVTVPQSRQKHVVPFCERGAVRVDDRSLAWDITDGARLGTYRRMRRLGFGERALAEAVPRWPILRKLARPDQVVVLDEWGHLDEWRGDPDRLDVAAQATRKDK